MRKRLLKVGQEYEYNGHPVRLVALLGDRCEKAVIQPRITRDQPTIDSSELGKPWSEYGLP